MKEWIWMPHPGHLIVADRCRFHLNTWVPSPNGAGYIVSTVGEYVPDSPVREILAEARGVVLQGRGDAREADWMAKCGYEEIGCGRQYETMVFHAQREPEDSCCLYRMSDPCELDSSGYNSPLFAYKGHMEMCAEWSGREVNSDATLP